MYKINENISFYTSLVTYTKYEHDSGIGLVHGLLKSLVYHGLVIIERKVWFDNSILSKNV